MAGLRNAGRGTGRKIPLLAEVAGRVESRQETGHGGGADHRAERAARRYSGGVARGGVEVKTHCNRVRGWRPGTGPVSSLDRRHARSAAYWTLDHYERRALSVVQL